MPQDPAPSDEGEIAKLGRLLDTAATPPALPPLGQFAIGLEIDAIRRIRDDWTSQTSPALMREFSFIFVEMSLAQLKWSGLDRTSRALVDDFQQAFVACMNDCADHCQKARKILDTLNQAIRGVNAGFAELAPALSEERDKALQKISDLYAQHHFTGDPTRADLVRALVPYATDAAIDALQAAVDRAKDELSTAVVVAKGLEDTATYAASVSSALKVVIGDADNIANASKTAQTAAAQGKELDDAILIIEIDALFKNEVSQILNVSKEVIGNGSP